MSVIWKKTKTFLDVVDEDEIYLEEKYNDFSKTLIQYEENLVNSGLLSISIDNSTADNQTVTDYVFKDIETYCNYNKFYNTIIPLDYMIDLANLRKKYNFKFLQEIIFLND